MEQHVYDMIVIGGGPGGYTAALYAARAGMDVVVLERLSPGGQMAQSHQIDNYPGFPEGIEGFQLGIQMQQQAERFQTKTVFAKVLQVELLGKTKVVHSSEGTFLSKTVVYATGADPRQLGLPMEKELVGKGISYCATCDGMFYRDKTVVVVGGGNSAAGEALLLSRIAKRVILVHRGSALRAGKTSQEALIQTQNVAIHFNSTVEKILHRDTVTGVEIRDVASGILSQISCDGVFISIGRKPATDLVRSQLTLDEQGYVVADESTRCNLPGVYAVGDVRTKPVRQIVTATADGAVAVHMAETFLAKWN